MRPTIDIDDVLMAGAKVPSGRITRWAIVEAAPRAPVCLHKQTAAMERLNGLGWQGDLERMRDGRDFE